MNRKLHGRDYEILAQLSKGVKFSVIAKEFGVTDRTVRRHVMSMCKDIGVNTPVEAIVWAVRNGLI